MSGQRRLPPAFGWVGLVGVATLIAASGALEKGSFPLWARAALAGGAIVWVALAFAVPREPLGPLDPPARSPRLFLLGGSLAAAALAFWKMPAQEFRLVPVLFWIAAIALWLLAWRVPAASAGALAPVGPRRRAEWVAFAVVLAVGAFFCFWRLGRVPPNPVSDHAEEMLDMLDLLRGRHAIYYMRNLGREPFHFYWTCSFVAAGLPLHYLTLKIATGLVGLLGLVALYAAGRELGGPALGLAAAALAAWGKWNFSLARQGLDYTYAILPTAVVIWALARWQRRGDRHSVLAAGLAIGCGLYGYTSFRVTPLLVPLALGVALADRRRAGKRWSVVTSGLLVTATAILVALPLLKFAFLGENRDFFWSRSWTRATGTERSLPGPAVQIFAGNLWNMARAFHWRGSSTWTVMLQDDPFLDVVTGGLLLAGVAFWLVRILRGDWRWSWLLPALILLTLPSTLSLAYPNENPSLNRAGPSLPVIFLLSALALAAIGRAFWSQRVVARTMGLGALGAMLAFSIQRNARVYFVDFAQSYDHMIEHAMEMAKILREARASGIPSSNMYLLGVDFWVDGRNIAFQIDEPAWADNHLLPAGDLPEGLTQRPLLFIYHPTDTSRLERLRKLYPGIARLVPQTFADRNFGVHIAR